MFFLFEALSIFLFFFHKLSVNLHSMKRDRIISDKELGQLIVRENPRVKRLIFRTKKDAIYVSVPTGTAAQEVDRAIETLRSKLLVTKQKQVHKLIDLDYRIDAANFKLSFVVGEYRQFLVRSTLDGVQIVCPPQTNFEDDRLQVWLNKVVEEALRHKAKIVLPAQLHALSQHYHLPFQGVKINASKGRWGSCSSSKNINLSFFLLLLPQHLIDYVLLHELCHTCEMNHGDRFWQLLDKLTQGRALQLRDELRKQATTLNS